MALASTIASSTMIDYPTIFRGHIIRSTQHILSRIRQAGVILTPEDRNQALHTLSYALKLPEAWPDTRVILLMMAPKMEQAGYRDEWMPFLEKGIQQSQHLDDAQTTAELHLQMGILYQLQSKYDEARSHLKVSARGFECLQAHRHQARALNRLAYVARLQRQFEEATSLVDRSHQLLDQKDVEQAYGYFVLGLIALDKRIWQEAIDYSNQALRVWEQDRDRRMMGRSLITIAAALIRQKKFQRAINTSQQAIDLFEELQDPIYKAIAQMHLGNAFLDMGQSHKALEFYLPAERIFRQLQEQLRLGHIYNNIAIAHRQLQQWDKAETAYKSSIKKYQEIGNIALMVDTMDGLGLTFLGQDQFDEARATFEEALSHLAQIEEESDYEHLFGVVSEHLQDVSKKITH